MNRRGFIGTVAGVCAFPAMRLLAQPGGSLREAARAMAARAYRPDDTPLSAPFADLDYDAYRAIRPIPGRAAMLPHGETFSLDLLPPGLFFPDPVTIDREVGGELQDVAFAPDLFDFDPRYFSSVPDISPGAGFSGLRLRYPLNAPGRMDEVLVVQGASYFRAIGQEMVYGLSARAVALGTGRAAPEEFPRFTHLRVHPAQGGRVRLEGVIDSPSLTGHLVMDLAPGQATVMQISTTIFPRVRIDDIGVAPLTSMYLKGPLRASVSDDFRPRVHDSDLLFIENGAGEHLWRPISNPAQVETSAFRDTGPRRFGLYQMPRSFEEYQDTEARYHDRPNCVVTPSGDWRDGAVVLVEIPTGTEFMDNVVAFWRPTAPLLPKAEYRFDYSLRWTISPPQTDGVARVLQSRSGREHDQPGARRYVIDIEGDADGRTAEISVQGDARITGVSLFSLPGSTATRVTFLLFPGNALSVDLRLSLSEASPERTAPVWLHRWTRARDGGV